MRIFLKDIASDLLNEYGGQLADHCVVFPNNRSILFFRKYLSELIDKPLFMPSLHTITSLLRGQSSLDEGEPVQLIYELYKVYIGAGNRKESFDEFYHWGEMLLGDFNDIDKYLVDPDLIFTNLADLKEIDQKFGGLDENIIAIIKQFWTNFEVSNMTGEKKDFLNVWETLPAVYRNFNKVLKSKGLAYEGMISREQVKIVEASPAEWMGEIAVFHFVGFNALNKCEKTILRELKKSKRAKFYWDYDPYYVDNTNHEAGHFIRQNIGEFPPEREYPVNGEKQCRISVYSAPSEVAQTKLIPVLISDTAISDNPNETAIILADENLLVPVLNSLPETVKNINVTMGYPLFHTPVYSLVSQLLRLHKNRSAGTVGITFYYNDVINILQHQYVAFNFPADAGPVINEIKEKNLLRVNRDSLLLNELFRLIFTDAFNNRTFLQEVLACVADLFESNQAEEDGNNPRLKLQQEYIYNLILPLNQLSLIMEDTGMDPGIDLYSRLIDRIMRQVLIPFSGEPLEGLQVMGILETRSLDFKNIIFLSANEGRIPKSPAGNSYIPYNLREAFGLPTIKHSDSIFAYYFYRLLHRTRNVSFIYNSSSDGLRSGEMSRYLLQIKYDEKYTAAFVDTRFNILPAARAKEVIEKTPPVIKAITSLYLDDGSSKYLSPSGINTWISCKMKFYYRYIAGIEETQEIMEEVDALAFGNILHLVMKEIYFPQAGKVLMPGDIDKLLSGESHLRKMAEKAFRKVFMKNSPGEIRGKNLVIISIIEKMIRQILKADKKHAPFKIVTLEEKYKGSVSAMVNGKNREIPLGGTIDRVDQSGEVFRILDYKSGADSVEIKDIRSLFDYGEKNRNSAAFQTLLYCELYMQNAEVRSLRPSLYPVRKIFDDNFSDIFILKNGEGRASLESYAAVRNIFLEGLTRTLSDIFDPAVNIEMTSDSQKCRYCPYNILCNRKV
ncbi:MAG: PD-(D/E)XK nuclease family protein [Bacteroidales bacterium]|nr:PD-(D/E)XK nuclease family protein [Bacteroidales bacterium]